MEVKGRLSVVEILRVVWAILGGPKVTAEEFMSIVDKCCVDAKPTWIDDFVFRKALVDGERIDKYPTVIMEHHHDLVRLKFCNDLQPAPMKMFQFKLGSDRAELVSKLQRVVDEAQRPDYDEMSMHLCLPLDELLAPPGREEEL